MKRILRFAGLLILIFGQSAHGVEHGQLKASLGPDADSKDTATVSLGQGDRFTFIGPLLGDQSIALAVDVDIQGATHVSHLPLAVYSSSGAQPLLDPLHVVGPAVVYLKNHDTSSPAWACVSYKVERAAELQYKQVNIVSLPAGSVGEGTHELVVEASDDLQNWAPVHSSAIAGDRGFFRMRIVRISE